MKYFILTLGLFLTTNIGFAQETKRLTAEKHNEYGLIYSLPQTHLDIEVVATKRHAKPALITNMPKIFGNTGSHYTRLRRMGVIFRQSYTLWSTRSRRTISDAIQTGR